MKRKTLIFLLSLIVCVSSINISFIKSINAKNENANAVIAAKENSDSSDIDLKITNHPKPQNFKLKVLTELPKYDPNSKKIWQVDLRNCDISNLNLENKLEDLKHSSYDNKTKWTNKMPKEFNPEKVMELGKNPGLNIRKVHQKGITGKNIGIAIIDQSLLVDHVEYKDRLKCYEEINWNKDICGNISSMHGPAVASIAVGKNVGVAPGADLYFIACTPGNYIGQGEKMTFEYDFSYLAKAIYRVLEINEALPENKKIRVISMSIGWNPSQKGYKEISEAVNIAKEKGIFIVSSNIASNYSVYFHGLDRNFMSNPDEFASYKPGVWWKNKFYQDKNYLHNLTKIRTKNKSKEALLVPMDSRTTASPTGNENYVFYPYGGWSWSIPYIAGLYALSCEANPNITPETFWDEALKTGDTVELKKDNKIYYLGKIVNAEKLIKKIK